MKAHKLSEIFPLMEGQELDALAQDIKENGLREKIVVYHEKILDGRNREAACQMAGVTPRYVEYSGKDPIGFIISHNLHRRHLDESQRALVAAKLADMRQGQRTDLDSANLPKVNQTQAGNALNVSPRLVGDAKKVLENGTAEEIKKVERGEKSASAAAKEIREKEKKEQEPEADPLAAAAKDYCGTLNAYTRQLDTWGREFAELKRDPLGHDVHWESVLSQLVAVRKALHQGRPRCRCPYCKSTGKKGKDKCGSCKGTGYVCKSIYTAGCKAVGVPEEQDTDE